MMIQWQYMHWLQCIGCMAASFAAGPPTVIRRRDLLKMVSVQSCYAMFHAFSRDSRVFAPVPKQLRKLLKPFCFRAGAHTPFLVCPFRVLGVQGT